MREEIIDGIPVLISERESPPRTVRIKIKPRRIRDMGIRQLPKKNRQALQNYLEQGMTNKKKAAIDAGFASAEPLNRVLERKQIVKAINKAGGTDKFIAEKLVEGVDAKHPQFPKNKDYHASIKFLQELNKVKDNHPATKISKEERSIHIHLTAEDYRQHQKFKEMRGEND